MRIIFVMFLSGLLMACSPDYNWRQVSIADGAVQALFPDKPTTQERTFEFDGHELHFGLTAVSVNKALFAVGFAPLPTALEADKTASEQLASTVIRSLYDKLGVQPPAPLPALGQAFTIDGNTPQGPMRLRAKVWLSNHSLVQAAVTADTSSFPEQPADEFLNSLVLAH